MLAANVLDGIAYLMHYTELYGCFWEYALDCIREAFETVHTAYHDVLNTPVLQICEHLQPEIRTLALCHIHAKKFLMAFLIDAQYIVNGTSNGTAAVVLYFVMDGIKPAD